MFEKDKPSEFVHRNTKTYREGPDDGWMRAGEIKKDDGNRFIKKSYTFPSGKHVWVQGSEPKALDILLNDYAESDIVVDDDAIARFIGKIYYKGLDGKDHRYIPDIYIISERKIIEVKSSFTYKIQSKTNNLKELACLKAGYRFEFMIL
ncbi:MAG: hypothetical protein WC979_01600 [Candidatus Pacearchaeota archaeon]|jgi:hypothetical protein|nr:hypothetical protein [Clostridia bacterium]